MSTIIGQKYSPSSAQSIRNIVAYLGGVALTELPTELGPLRTKGWHAAENKTDRGYRPSPSELYAVYQRYMFESQALFLDVPVNVQNNSGRLWNSLV